MNKKQQFDGLVDIDVAKADQPASNQQLGRKRSSPAVSGEAHLAQTDARRIKELRRRGSTGRSNLARSAIKLSMWSSSSTSSSSTNMDSVEQGNKCGKCQNHEFEVSKKDSVGLLSFVAVVRVRQFKKSEATHKVAMMFEENGNKCGKCQNHDYEVLKKGHARDCPFKKCDCLKCRLLDARSDILQVISGKETKLKGTKKDPNCGFCQNHGVKILRKGHVRSCGFGQERHFRLENCFDCEVHYIRNEVNRLQIKMRRAMKEDRTLSEEQRKTAREAITRDEVEKVCDMARLARKKRENILTQQMVADELVSSGPTQPAMGHASIQSQVGNFEQRKRSTGSVKINAHSPAANLLLLNQHSSPTSSSSSASLLVKEEQLVVVDEPFSHHNNNHLHQRQQQQQHQRQLASVWRPWSQHQVAAAIAAQQHQLGTFNGNRGTRGMNLAPPQAAGHVSMNNQPPAASSSSIQQQQHLASLLNSAAMVGPNYLINSIQQQQQQQQPPPPPDTHRQPQQISCAMTNIHQQQLATLHSNHDDSSTSSTSVNIDVDCFDDEDEDDDEDADGDDNVSSSSMATECHLDTNMNLQHQQQQQQQQSFHQTPPESPSLLSGAPLRPTCSNIGPSSMANPTIVQEPLQLTHRNNGQHQHHHHHHQQQQSHLQQSQQTQQQQQQLFDTIFRLIFAQFAQSNRRS